MPPSNIFNKEYVSGHVSTEPFWVSKVKASSPDVSWETKSYSSGSNLPPGKHHVLKGTLAVIFSNDVIKMNIKIDLIIF